MAPSSLYLFLFSFLRRGKTKRNKNKKKQKGTGRKREKNEKKDGDMKRKNGHRFYFIFFFSCSCFFLYFWWRWPGKRAALQIRWQSACDCQSTAAHHVRSCSSTDWGTFLSHWTCFFCYRCSSPDFFPPLVLLIPTFGVKLGTNSIHFLFLWNESRGIFFYYRFIFWFLEFCSRLGTLRKTGNRRNLTTLREIEFHLLFFSKRNLERSS